MSAEIFEYIEAAISDKKEEMLVAGAAGLILCENMDTTVVQLTFLGAQCTTAAQIRNNPAGRITAVAESKFANVGKVKTDSTIFLLI